MAFWRFGFAAHSAIDTLLTAPASPTPSNPTSASAPTAQVPPETLDKLLEEEDLLQEVKNQHEKLVDFLCRKEVVSRLLGYIDGWVFDAEESDRKGKEKADGPAPKPAADDLFSSLLSSSTDLSNPSSSLERRKVRNPYLCTEILASDLPSLLDTIFSSPSALLGPFWDHVLDSPPEEVALKSVQLGHWARANGVFFNKRPKEMLAFVKSRPKLIERLLTHFGSSPIVDVVFRMVQCELDPAGQGTIDWLAGESLVPRLVALLSPANPPELHSVVSDFLKNVITFCTNPHSVGGTVAAAAPPPPIPGQPPPASNDGGGPKLEEARPKFLNTRLMRELAYEDTVALMLQYGLDEFPIPETSSPPPSPSVSAPTQLLYPPPLDLPQDSLPNAASSTSSLIHCLSVMVDLIRRNNSDFVEQEMLAFYRRLERDKEARAEEAELSEFDGEAESATGAVERPPSIVPLGPMLSVIFSRLGTLQSLIRCPRSTAYGLDVLSTTVGPIGPLTLERFRICELYAELLHCSNMALLNRPEGKGPQYDDEGFLVGGREAVDGLVEALTPAKGRLDPMEMLDESQVVREALPASPEEPSLPYNAKDSPLLAPRRPSHNARDPMYSPPRPDSPGSDSSETPSIDSETGVLTRSEADELRGILEESELEPLKKSGDATKRTTYSGTGTPQSRVASTPSSRRYSVPLVNYAASGKRSRRLSQLTPGDALKAAFRQHQVLETCIDLFFTYPWHNFLHNTIYDLVQQIFSGRMDQEGNLALAQTLLVDAALVEKILQGDGLNTEVCSTPHGSRLGYMGHMILMAAEVEKALQAYPTELGLSAKATDSIPQPAWDFFVASAVKSAREQSAQPLGGSVPIVLPGPPSSTSDSTSDDDDDVGGIRSSGWGDPTTNSSAPSNQGFGPSSLAAADQTGKDDEFARYLVSQINSQTGDRFSSSGSEDSDEEEGAGWVRSTGFGTKEVRSNVGGAGRGEKSFGFDDRFDSPARGFGHRFEDQDDGFGDDFGPFSDAAVATDPFGDDNFAPFAPAPSNSTGAKKRKPPPPAVPPRKNLTVADWNADFRKKVDHGSRQDVEASFGGLTMSPGNQGAHAGDDDDDGFGDFAGASTSHGRQDSWTDFDLKMSPDPPPAATPASPPRSSSASTWSFELRKAKSRSPPQDPVPASRRSPPQVYTSRLPPTSPRRDAIPIGSRPRRRRSASVSSEDEPLGPGVHRGTKITKEGMLEAEVDGHKVVVPKDDIVTHLDDED